EREENKMICPKCDGLKGYYKIPADYWGKCDCCGTPEVMRSPDPDEHWQKCEFCKGEGHVSALRLTALQKKLRITLRKKVISLFYKECPVCGMKARKIRRLQNA